MTDYLTLEQVRFITATVAPHFGPMIDRAVCPVEDFENNLDAVKAWALQALTSGLRSNDALPLLIVTEAYGDIETAAKYGDLAGRANSIINVNLALHDHGELFGAIVDELAKHCSSIRGEPV